MGRHDYADAFSQALKSRDDAAEAIKDWAKEGLSEVSAEHLLALAQIDATIALTIATKEITEQTVWVGRG